MALNIEQASVGYDTMGIQTFITNLNLNVITDLITKMNEEIPNLRQVVDQVWVGQGANAFKAKLERDFITMTKTLEAIKDSVDGQFAQIAQNVDNYDSAIAENIANME